MARYVMANRRAGMPVNPAEAQDQMAEAFARLGQVRVISDAPGPRRVVVFEGEPRDVEARRSALPEHVLLEPEILHYPSGRISTVQRPFIARALPTQVGAGVRLALNVRGEGAPVVGALVILVLRLNLNSTLLEARTDAGGTVVFSFNPAWTPTALIVLPAGNFWSILVPGPRDGSVVDLPPLPRTGPLAWWHRALGIENFDPERGAGIKVGVIDTGVGPHPMLAHVKSIGAFLGGEVDPAGGADSDEHGSHVCGIIGARPDEAGAFAGVAPGVELFSARVFASADAGANQGDIAAAIDALAGVSQVDLINLSLGAPVGSAIELDAIQAALEQGTLCIAAAGNSAGPVSFPAAFRECIAVAALGFEGWGPPGSLSADNYPDQEALYGLEGLFFASFSCFGNEIDCAAPGVGIISTVPERFGLMAPFAALDGTSMASPAACAALAAALATRPDYLALPRSLVRAETARRILRSICRDTGLPAPNQGRGLPTVS